MSNLLFLSRKLINYLSRCANVGKVKYLGHVISKSGMAVDAKKVSPTLEWPEPAIVKALRGYLGFIGYYQKFVEEYMVRSQPLLLKCLGKIHLFGILSKAMTCAALLALTNCSETFLIECDASSSGVGAVSNNE